MTGRAARRRNREGGQDVGHSVEGEQDVARHLVFPRRTHRWWQADLVQWEEMSCTLILIDAISVLGAFEMSSSNNM